MTIGERLRAILGQRCPACGRGRVFLGPMTMNERCPDCGLVFQREAGYFLGAMYFSYMLGIPAILLLILVAYLILPGWRLWQLFLLAWAAFLPLVPVVFRYSRVLWLHADRLLDPEKDR